MFLASNRGAGGNMGFPDVCNTPAVPAPIPVPYPNIAMNAQASPFSDTVKVSMMNALNLASKIPMTSGDEAGSASPIKGASGYTMGSPNVNVDMMPAINLTCPTTGNNMNNPIGAVLTPSATNVSYNYRTGTPTPTSLALEDVERLGAAVSVRDPLTEIRMLDGTIGVVAVSVFTRDLPTLLHNEVVKLRERGMASLVLDLRGCPGGDLDAAIRLADDFLERGSEIVTAVDGDGDEAVYRARGGDPYRFPLLLLVDRRTASAAELFAGCLKAHGRAVVVGERTYGKGTAQRLVPGFAAPGAHYATVATFTLPDGQPIEGRGIRTDVEVFPGDALAAARAAASGSPLETAPPPDREAR